MRSNEVVQRLAACTFENDGDVGGLLGLDALEVFFRSQSETCSAISVSKMMTNRTTTELQAVDEGLNTVSVKMKARRLA